MASDEPGPGQQYALARPGITIEVRWCPAHKGIVGNEKADEWAKEAAAEQSSSEVLGPDPASKTRGRRAPSRSPSPSQAGGLGEEVDRGSAMGGKPNLQDEIPIAKEPKA